MYRAFNEQLKFFVAFALIVIFLLQIGPGEEQCTMTNTAQLEKASLIQRSALPLDKSDKVSSGSNFTSNTTVTKTSLPSLEEILLALSSELKQMKESDFNLSSDAVEDLQQIFDFLPKKEQEIVPSDPRKLQKNLPYHFSVDKLLPEDPVVLPEFPKVNVSEDKVLSILLLTYPRTDNTFIGGLFNPRQNREVFYIHEPLDQVYAAMYGTDFGWAVPADIRVLPNGTARTLPERELAAIDTTLESVYSCSMSKLPVAILLHPYWENFSGQMDSVPYRNCLRLKHIQLNKTLSNCRMHIKTLCSGHFDGKNPKLSLCQQALYNNGAWKSSIDQLKKFATPQEADLFLKYHKCLAGLETNTRGCAVQHFDKPCKTKRIRVVKTIRATMLTAQRLLQKKTNLKVVHSFQDPRGAVPSISSGYLSKGHYNEGVRSKVARTYCDAVLGDSRLKKQLEKDHDGRLLRFLYDDYLQRKQEVVGEITKFAEIKISSAYKQSMVRGAKTNVLSGGDQSWQNSLKPKEVVEINKQCLSFFKEIEFNWPFQMLT